LLIDEKNLLSEQPLHALFNESQNDIYIFHRFESRDEIGYSKYDENGEKIIDSNIISDIDLWILYNPIATIDKDKNIVIFWFIPNFCHKCYFDSSYATIFHCCFRLFFPERTFE